MRDWEKEKRDRIVFINKALKDAGAEGIVFGNSGGKDSVLVGILCRAACDNVLGVIMPCGSKRNYEADMTDALLVAKQYGIAIEVVDLSGARNAMLTATESTGELNSQAINNIAPRLRMTALYALAQSRRSLVAGTGNRSERYMGYFTKWGDGAFDFNPIGDLTVREVYDFLRFLGAPEWIFSKAPSAGLFDGQTDEKEMGITYRRIDDFLLTGTVDEHDQALIERFHKSSEHKRKMPVVPITVEQV